MAQVTRTYWFNMSELVGLLKLTNGRGAMVYIQGHITNWLRVEIPKVLWVTDAWHAMRRVCCIRYGLKYRSPSAACQH